MSNDLAIYEPQNLTELRDFCALVTKTQLVPAAYQGKQDDAMVAIMYGKETAGLGPLTSLQYVAVISGKPAFYSDALPGIAFNKRLITDMEESFEGKPYDDDFTAVCVVTRQSGSKVTQRFSVADAKKAGLWDQRETVQRRNKKTGETYTTKNDSTWYRFPKRMLQWRARGWAIRDAAPHALFGPTAEELEDVVNHRGPENARDVTPTSERSAQPTAEPQYVTLYDAWGAEYLVEPGEIAQWIKNAVDGSSIEELNALVDNNQEREEVAKAVTDEKARRTVGETLAPVQQPLEAAESQQSAANGDKPKSAKQWAEEIDAAFRGAPNLTELLKLEERVREDMGRLPDSAKAKLARVFHERREELTPPFDDTADAIADLEGRDEDARQQEML